MRVHGAGIALAITLLVAGCGGGRPPITGTVPRQTPATRTARPTVSRPTAIR